MKKFTLLLLTVSFVFADASAKIRRVGFFGSPIAGTDYINFAAAYTAAASGDTILMFPATSFTATISKKLIIIGPGNWLDPNDTPAKGNANLQAFAGIATVSNITFDPGSDGSVLTGFYGATAGIRDNNITIARNCEIMVYVTYNNISTTITNLQILQNYRVSIQQYYNNGSGSTNMNISTTAI